MPQGLSLGATVPFYGGVQVDNPADVITFNTVGAPSNNAATGNPVIAVNPSLGTVYFSAKQGTWIALTGGSSGIASITGTAGGSSPATGAITIGGAGTASVSSTASTITVTAGLTWVNNAMATTMAINTGYIVTAGAEVFTLPGTAPIGSIINLVLNGGTSWQITLGGGKTIGSVVAGAPQTYSTSITSNNTNYTYITLVCTVANTGWIIQSLNGSISGT